MTGDLGVEEVAPGVGRRVCAEGGEVAEGGHCVSFVRSCVVGIGIYRAY